MSGQATPVPLRSPAPEGLTRVGWRNLFDGELRLDEEDPGYGWCPVYVDSIRDWIPGLKRHVANQQEEK